MTPQSVNIFYNGTEEVIAQGTLIDFVSMPYYNKVLEKNMIKVFGIVVDNEGNLNKLSLYDLQIIK